MRVNASSACAAWALSECSSVDVDPTKSLAVISSPTSTNPRIEIQKLPKTARQDLGVKGILGTTAASHDAMPRALA